MNDLLVILGPTASGKSSLAMMVAERFGGEILNADALQVYRGLDVGTAKPSDEERRRIRHHLVDILDPVDSFSAGEFARRARAAIEDIRQREAIPIVVGGSGLYLRALLSGLSPVPAIPPEIRERLRERQMSEGLEAIRADLRVVDPSLERKLAKGDTQRVVRALEVWQATGRTMSSWQEEESRQTPLAAVKIGLTLPRTVLYDRIAHRAAMMIESGWVEEVEQLLGGGLSGAEPAFQAIGYRDLVDHIQHGIPLSDVLERIVVATRQYAKRQLTWFRREADISWFPAEETDVLVASVSRFLTGLQIRSRKRSRAERRGESR